MIYLDWAATAPPDRAVLEEAHKEALAGFANPSSIHPAGEAAQRLLHESRELFASSVGCAPDEVVFTSGGSESNNLVINSFLNAIKFKAVKSEHGKYSGSGRRTESPKILVSGIEHASVFEPAKNLAPWGFAVRFLPVDSSGVLDPGCIEDQLDKSTRLVTVMQVNNETGAIQPVSKIARIVGSYAERTGRRILFHTDAVQALGKVLPGACEIGAGTASYSAHKLGGPRGVGALYRRKDCPLNPIYAGGGQEGGLRPGTENLEGITGFALIAAKSTENFETNYKRATNLMNALIGELAGIRTVCLVPEERIDIAKNPNALSFSPYILNLALPPVPGEIMVRVMGENGIHVSAGSACSSNAKNRKYRSRILKNMAVSNKIASSSIRLSIGPSTSQNDLDRFIEILKKESPALIRSTL